MAASESPSPEPLTAAGAHAAAAAWVEEVARRQPGFRGAYLAGSLASAPSPAPGERDAPWPPYSDVDIMVASEGAGETTRGKFRYRGALLEASRIPTQRLAQAESVLADYHLAHGLWEGSILSDPDGLLTPLQEAVRARFCEARWVRRRAEQALQKADRGLAGVNAEASLAQGVLAWAFSAGVSAHVLLASALRNPTVRRRYAAARQVLADYGHAALYPGLLAGLGCEGFAPAQASAHLAALARAFDEAAAAARTPLPYSCDVTPLARPVAIEGSAAMIAAGDHREATFWILVTSARCQQILALDGTPAARAAHTPAFRALLTDLGIRSPEDLPRRAAQVRRWLPRLWAVAEEVLRANPHVQHGLAEG